MSSIHYTISPISPEEHLFEINCTVNEPATEGQKFNLPAWIPGSYMIRDFAKNIVSITAQCNGQSIKIRKLDKQTWQCMPCKGELVIHYSVYSWDLSVRSAHLDTTHGFYNGSSVFLRVCGQEHKPCEIMINPPVGSQYRHWRVATSLSTKESALRKFGRYKAKDYDDLIDHPVEMGDFDVVTFEIKTVAHDIVFSGKHTADLNRIAADLTRICRHHIDLFGELPAMERYVFLVMCVGDGYGGLEHRASCSLLCSRKDLPQKHETGISEGYRQFLGLCSHEYFHTWNIKQIKPETFMPYKLDSESYTRLLWAFEGITSYYDDLSLVRCGLITLESYLELLGRSVTRLLRNPGRQVQTVTESSFDAWTKFYKQDENAINAIVSYYIKGAVIACALDLTIRLKTGTNKSLDDVMRALWQRYGKAQKGIAENKLESEISESVGLDLQAFFDHALYQTEEIDLASLLSEFGVSMQLRVSCGKKDKGGKPVGSNDDGVSSDIGILASSSGAGVKILSVIKGGAAQKAGLSAADEIIAINGLRVSALEFESIVNRYQVGESLEITAFRRDELMTFRVQLEEAPKNTCYFTVTGEVSGWISEAE